MQDKSIKVDAGYPLGSRIRDERERLKLSQEDFGAHAGVTRLTQSKYESNHNYPNVLYLKAIEELGADIGYILNGEKGVYKSFNDACNEEAELVFEVVEAIEKAIIETNIQLNPSKKARVAAAVYRNRKGAKSINQLFVFDMLILASE